MPQIWGSAFIALIMIPRGEEIGVFWLVKQMHFSVLYRQVRYGGGGMKLPFFVLFVVNFSERCVCVTRDLIEVVQHARACWHDYYRDK